MTKLIYHFTLFTHLYIIYIVLIHFNELIYSKLGITCSYAHILTLFLDDLIYRCFYKKDNTHSKEQKKTFFN